MSQAEAIVDKTIVERILPEAYVVIDDLLDHVKDDIPRGLLMRAKKLLPSWAPHSMEQSPPKGKK